jgi:transcriptional regulator with GAF, ATPase, and Fis domain
LSYTVIIIIFIIYGNTYNKDDRKMNKNEFFREVAIRISGDLEIEKAMFSTFQYLRQKMPVDRMALQHYDEEMDSMRTIALVTTAGGEGVDLLTPLSQEAKKQATQQPLDNQSNAYLIKNPDQVRLAQEMLQYHGFNASSIIVTALTSGGRMIGNLVLISEGEEVLSREHAELISLLSEPIAIAMSNTLEHREVLRLKNLMADDNRYLHGELRRLSGEKIIGANFGLREVMYKVRQVATLSSPVLLLGETGTGKDVIANAIHYSSQRHNAPFVSVNCGAIPETLIDSELFGHEKGAFTGALAQKRGRFERADTGTIFLDEIGELPLQAQVRFLKVLQSKEIERVGGIKTIPLDIRVIAATNRDLGEMVKRQLFREDLWFRLNVFPIWIPPLRERKSDIPALLQHFIELKSRELKLTTIPSLTPGSVDSLMEYNWPGNVRELQNIVERELILNPSGPLTFENFSPSAAERTTLHQKSSGQMATLDEIIIQHIRQVLARTGGKIHGSDGAAEILGINASTLRNRMNKLKISYRKKDAK